MHLAIFGLAALLVHFVFGILSGIVKFFFGGLTQGIKRSRRLGPPKDGYAHAIDGDTLAMMEDRFRIWGIDAPEMGQPEGPASRLFLANAIKGKKLLFKPVDVDKYGRTVARVYIVEGQRRGIDLAEMMVLNGHAYPDGDGQKTYKRSELEARRNKRGVWAPGRDRTSPKAWRDANK